MIKHAIKRILFFILLTTFAFESYAQIIFEKGYYIDNSGQKIECLIKNVDWRSNPTEFQYQLKENSDTQKATIKSIKEFGIYNVSKFLRVKVLIDRSSKQLEELSSVKQPIFNEEELFLKVLIQGEASLYEYVDVNLTRYFYSKENNAVRQLIFKSFKNIEGKVGNNEQYKQQLWTDLQCSTLPLERFERLDYRKKPLIKLFSNYNQCNDQQFINFEEKQNNDFFNLNIRPGLNRSSLSLSNSLSSSRNADFDSQISLRFGIEAELILPFNKNKWAFIIEPTYQSYKSEAPLSLSNFQVEYESIELPLGVRHYFFLSDQSKIFVNGLLVLDFDFNSVIDVGADLEIETVNNVAFGLGYKHMNKYIFEFRYQTSRELLTNIILTRAEYNTLSVIFGYSIF